MEAVRVRVWSVWWRARDSFGDALGQNRSNAPRRVRSRGGRELRSCGACVHVRRAPAEPRSVPPGAGVGPGVGGFDQVLVGWQGRGRVISVVGSTSVGEATLRVSLWGGVRDPGCLFAPRLRRVGASRRDRLLGVCRRQPLASGQPVETPSWSPRSSRGSHRSHSASEASESTEKSASAATAAPAHLCATAPRLADI